MVDFFLDVCEKVDSFSDEARASDPKEAESLLDRVMAMLGIDHADGVPNAKKPPGPPANIAVKMQQAERQREAVEAAVKGGLNYKCQYDYRS